MLHKDVKSVYNLLKQICKSTKVRTKLPTFDVFSSQYYFHRRSSFSETGSGFPDRFLRLLYYVTLRCNSKNRGRVSKQKPEVVLKNAVCNGNCESFAYFFEDKHGNRSKVQLISLENNNTVSMNYYKLSFIYMLHDMEKLYCAHFHPTMSDISNADREIVESTKLIAKSFGFNIACFYLFTPHTGKIDCSTPGTSNAFSKFVPFPKDPRYFYCSMLE